MSARCAGMMAPHNNRKSQFPTSFFPVPPMLPVPPAFAPPIVHRPLILTFVDPALKLVRAPATGTKQTQGRGETGTRGREMRQTVHMRQRVGRRTPRAAMPGLFPVLPLLPLLCFDPSTQPGTPRWTHHHVTPSKQRTGVEPARNFIPTPSTLVFSVPGLRTRGLTAHYASHRMNRGKISELAARRRSRITNHESRITSHDHV
jgi:hypothetical protein